MLRPSFRQNPGTAVAQVASYLRAGGKLPRDPSQQRLAHARPQRDLLDARLSDDGRLQVRAADGHADPQRACYDCQRGAMPYGELTDDELANAVFLDPSIGHLTAAKMRIRWLSRRLVEADELLESRQNPRTAQLEPLNPVKRLEV